MSNLNPAPPARDGGYPTPRRAWWTVAVLLLLYIGSYLDRQILALMVDRVKADLHINDFQISLLQGMSFALFYTLFGLPFGWAADRLPRRWIIMVGVCVWSVMASACGLAHTFWQLLIARFGVGVGEAALSPAAFSLLSDNFPKHRLAFAMSIFTSGAVFGSALSLAVGGLAVGLLPVAGVVVPILGRLAGWQFVFILTGLPCLLMGWLIFTVNEPARRGRKSERPTRPADSLRFLRSRGAFFGGHFVGFGLMSMCGYGLLVWAPSYMQRVFGWGSIVVGPALAMAMLSGAVGAVAMGAIVDRWFKSGRQDAHLRLFVIVSVLQPTLVVAAVAMHEPRAFLVLITAALAMGTFTGVAGAALQIVTPNEFRGQVSSVFLLVFNLLGLGCGPSIVAAITSYVFRDDLMVGWSIALTFVVVMPFAGLCFALAMKPMRLAVAASLTLDSQTAERSPASRPGATARHFKANSLSSRDRSLDPSQIGSFSGESPGGE